MQGWRWLGRVSHEEATRLMESTRARVLQGEAVEQIFLCEHDPVITLGRSARPEHVLLGREELAARGIHLTQASRGGDVTYHGPGQLVIYPVLRIGKSLTRFLVTTARVIEAACASRGVRAGWRREPAGVWVPPDHDAAADAPGAKLAAVGVHVHRGVAIHGWALNVSTPLEAFGQIVPCGLRCAEVTTLAAQLAAAGLGPPPSVEALAAELGPALAVAHGLPRAEVRAA